jgi:Haem-binding domain
MRRRRLSLFVVVVAALFLAIQAIPYGHDHGAPATTKRASFPAGDRALMAGACMDCHSNETQWPWYSNVAPASLLVVNDVKGGRKRLNFSQWDRPQPSLDEVLRTVRSKSMPPWQYKIIHGPSRLSAAERGRVEAAIRSAYKADAPPVRPGR